MDFMLLKRKGLPWMAMTGDNKRLLIIQKTIYLYLHFNTKTVRVIYVRSDRQAVRVIEEELTKQKYHEKHKKKILVGTLIILGIILFILFHERKELLIALYIILYLISPALIYMVSRWEEAEEEKKTAFQ